MAKYIIETGHKETLVNTKTEKENILRKAAQLIKTEIREKMYTNNFYPTSDDITEKWIPKALSTFLSHFTSSELRQESIGQAIVKLSSPQQIPPILFGLSVEIDNLFGSRWLIDEVFKLGFGVSYNEVMRFKQACVLNQSNKLEIPCTPSSDSFTQFIADNVDHNVATLNGEGTFHGMGILASTVINGNFNLTRIKMKRPSKLMKVEYIMSKSPAIHIENYIPVTDRQFAKIKLKPMMELMFPDILPKTVNVDIG